MSMRKSWLKDLRGAFYMAKDMCGCMHPEDMSAKRKDLDDLLNELVAYIQKSKGCVPVRVGTESFEGSKAPARKILRTRHVLQLECGHEVEYTGNYPKLRAHCHHCAE